MQLKDYKESELLDADEAIKLGLNIISSINSEFIVGKKYGEVQTYTKFDSNGEFWAARTSSHRDLSYELMYKYVFLNHTEYEAKYIPLIKSFEVLDSSGRWISRRITYKFPFPLKERDMDIWMLQFETKKGEEFINISIPREYSTKNVRGRYLSIELIRKVGDKVEWLMATKSDAGGWIPAFIQRMEMTKAIAKDIPEFKQWVSTVEK